MCEKDEKRIGFIKEHYPQVVTVSPEECKKFTLANSEHGGADVVLDVAGAEATFRLAWECARPNAIVTVVALYDKAQILFRICTARILHLKPAEWMAVTAKKHCS